MQSIPRYYINYKRPSPSIRDALNSQNNWVTLNKKPSRSVYITQTPNICNVCNNLHVAHGCNKLEKASVTEQN
jgi:hypothetical protein